MSLTLRDDCAMTFFIERESYIVVLMVLYMIKIFRKCSLQWKIMTTSFQIGKGTFFKNSFTWASFEHYYGPVSYLTVSPKACWYDISNVPISPWAINPVIGSNFQFSLYIKMGHMAFQVERVTMSEKPSTINSILLQIALPTWSYY